MLPILSTWVPLHPLIHPARGCCLQRLWFYTTQRKFFQRDTSLLVSGPHLDAGTLCWVQTHTPLRGGSSRCDTFERTSTLSGWDIRTALPSYLAAYGTTAHAQGRARLCGATSTARWRVQNIGAIPAMPGGRNIYRSPCWTKDTTRALYYACWFSIASRRFFSHGTAACARLNAAHTAFCARVYGALHATRFALQDMRRRAARAAAFCLPVAGTPGQFYAGPHHYTGEPILPVSAGAAMPVACRLAPPHASVRWQLSGLTPVRGTCTSTPFLLPPHEPPPLLAPTYLSARAG